MKKHFQICLNGFYSRVIKIARLFLFASVSMMFWIVELNAQSWANLGSGLDSLVWALTSNTNGNLYAGGEFTNAGGVIAHKIAKWNGESWASLGNGMDNWICALACDNNGNLYAGGTFTNAGGMAANRVAKWNGTSWTNLGSGLNAGVRALVCDSNGNLYAGGPFTNAGGVAANHIAKWNGSTWTNLGSGINGYSYVVCALAIGTNNELYAGGMFDTAGGESATSIAKWDGSDWTNLGSLSGPMGVGVYALSIGMNGELYAGGSFDTADDASVHNIAKWNGSSWTNLGNGINSTVYALSAGINNELYVGSAYAVINGVSSTNIAKWDGSGWASLIGITNQVYALAVGANGELYAGGAFTNAGGVTANYIAECTWPNLLVLGTNGAGIASRETVSAAKGTDFGTALWAQTLTSAFSITNGGNKTLAISSWDTNGIADSVFQIQFIPSHISAGCASNFSITFSPATVGTFTATVHIVNDSMTTPYILNLAGTGQKHDQSAMMFNPPSPQTYNTTNKLSVSGGSGIGSVSYVVLSGPGQIVSSTNLLVTAGTGIIQIRATKATDAQYNAASITATVVCAKAGQRIVFPVIPDQQITNIVILNATASSGLSVDFSVDDGPAQISGGSMLSFAGTGIVSVVASQAGNNNWNEATNVTNNFRVTAGSISDSVSSSACADYDGDGKADPAIYDEATRTWRVMLSSAGYYLILTTLNGLGGPGLVSVSADYDGDYKADPAVYRESAGLWTILKSSLNYAMWTFPYTLGGSGYSGMPGDYDGDNLADPCVYKRANGDWLVMLSSANYYMIEKIGLLGGTGYRAVAADYDGDGKADPAVYRENNGLWTILLSGSGYITFVIAEPLGGSGYLPVPADYDGDGLADPAVRSGTGNGWIVMFSSGSYAPVHLTISFE